MPNELTEAKVLRLRMEKFVVRREEPSSITTQLRSIPCVI